MKHRIAILNLVTFLVVFPAQGETGDSDPRMDLSLEEAVHLAESQSTESVLDNIAQKQAELTFQLSRLALRAPSASALFSLPSFQQGQTEALVYDPDLNETRLQWVTTENRFWQGRVNLTQPLPTGGQVRLESLLYQRNYLSDVTGSSAEELEYRSNWRLSISQELLRKSQPRVAREKAEVTFRLESLQINQSRRTRVMQTVETYFSILMQQRELEINRQSIELVRDALDLAKRKYDAGLIPEGDVLLLEVEFARSKIDLSSAETQLSTACEQFCDQLNLPVSQKLLLTSEPEFRPVKVELESARSRALTQREDAKSAEDNLLQSKLAIRDVKRSWSFSGELSAFYDLEQRGEALNQAISSSLHDYNVNRGVVFTLSYPLLSGGRRSVTVQQAELDLQESELRRDLARRSIALDVRQSIRELDEAEVRYQLSLRSLELAERNSDITRKRFETGQVTSRELIEAQLDLKRSRLESLRALISHVLAIARLNMSMGSDPLGRIAE